MTDAKTDAPARMWFSIFESGPIWAWSTDGPTDDAKTPYVRADVAEGLAQALKLARYYAAALDAPDGVDKSAHLVKIDAALAAYDAARTGNEKNLRSR
jgi:hypothetical protein